MPHSTTETPNPSPTSPNAMKIEQRFQAGLDLQRLYALPIYQVPPEIMLNIFNRLSLDDFPALISAAWHLLRHVGVAPVIPTARLKEILLWPRHGFYDSFEHTTSPGNPRYLPKTVRQSMPSRLAPRSSFFDHFTDMGRRMGGSFTHMPRELWNHVFRHLDAEAMVNLALAAFRFSDQNIEWLTHEEV